MFLVATQQTIEDFLKAVNFLAPEGTTLESFIVPESNYELPEELAPEYEIDPNYQSKSKVYHKVERTDRKCDALLSKPVELPQAATELPSTIQTAQDSLNEIKNGVTVNNNVKGIFSVVESISEDNFKRILEQEFCGFPKNTMFVFKTKKQSLTESFEYGKTVDKDTINSIKILKKQFADTTANLTSETPSMYIQQLNSYINSLSNAVLERADLINELCLDKNAGMNKATYNLPGVTASLYGTVNIEELKTKSARLAELEKIISDLNNKKDYFTSIISNYAKNFTNNIRTLLEIENNFDQILSMID